VDELGIGEGCLRRGDKSRCVGRGFRLYMRRGEFLVLPHPVSEVISVLLSIFLL
jgi:hypothetical protein